MQKIIAAFDSLRFSESTLRYTVELSKQANANVVSVFLDDSLYHSY